MIPRLITPTELRSNLYGVVRDVSIKRHQYLITPSEGEGVVMLSRQEYNKIIAERQLLRDLREGEADIAAGRVHTSDEVRSHLERHIGRGKSQSVRGKHKAK